MVFSVFSISMVCSTSTTFSAFASLVFSAWHELVTATLSTCRCYLSVPRQRVRGNATGTKTYKYKDYIVLKGSKRSVAEVHQEIGPPNRNPRHPMAEVAPTCGFSLATGVAISWEIWIPYGCWMLPAFFFSVRRPFIWVELDWYVLFDVVCIYLPGPADLPGCPLFI